MKQFKKAFAIIGIYFFYLSCPLLAIVHSESSLMKLKKIDKVELHLHLGGSWPLEYLKEIAAPKQIEQLSKMLDQIDGGMDYQEAFQIFDLISKIVNTDKKVEDGVAALCKSLADDGVIYAEIRTGLKNLGSGLEGYLSAVLRGIERGCASTNLNADVVLSVRRDTSLQTVLQTIDLIKKYRDNGVVGLDVSGISIQGNGDTIFQGIDRIQETNIPITLHIGESQLETAEQQMKELQILKPTRVGHCVHLCTQAQEWIKERKIPVEMCLTSAVKVGMIANYDQHPALELLTEGHPVVICTDDPLIFRTTLSQECAKVVEIMNISVDAMMQLQEKALDCRLIK